MAFHHPAFPNRPKPYISKGAHGFAQECAYRVAQDFHASKVYAIVSNSISKTDNFKKLQEALGEKLVGVRKGIRPHTPWDDILEIVKEVRDAQADVIVTLGAGSLTDGAKVVAFALANGVSVRDDLAALSSDAQKKDPKPCSIPLINIPTSLSGGEYSAFAGATDTRDHHKVSFAHPSMSASLIILDPALSITTPAQIWLSTGIRAVDHCVEGLCSLNSNVNAESDAAFKKGLEMLVPNLLVTKKSWEDEEPRLQQMLGVVEAMKGLGSGDQAIPMGGSHGIGHQLGPLGVGHGETSCIMLPAVLKYNARYGDARVKQAQQKVLDVFWGEEVIADVLRKRGLEKDSADSSDVVGAVISELQMPRRLGDVGIGHEKLDALAVNCLKDRWLKTNAVPLTEKSQVLEILGMAI